MGRRFPLISYYCLSVVLRDILESNVLYGFPYKIPHVWTFWQVHFFFFAQLFKINYQLYCSLLSGDCLTSTHYTSSERAHLGCAVTKVKVSCA